MPRKPSYAALEAENARLSAENSLLSEMVHHYWNDSPDAHESFTFDGSRYIIKLFGCMRAPGGVVEIVFRHKGQRDDVTVKRFEDWYREVMSLPYAANTTPWKDAAAKLYAARERIFEAWRNNAGETTP